MCKKGVSSSYIANTRLRDVFGSARPATQWISTKVMPADGPSRGLPLPDFPGPLDSTAALAVSIVRQQDTQGYSVPELC